MRPPARVGSPEPGRHAEPADETQKALQTARPREIYLVTSIASGVTKDEEEMWVRAMRTYLKRMTGTKGWTVRPLSKLLKAAAHELDLALPLSAEAAPARVEGVLASMSQLFDCALQSDGRPVDEEQKSGESWPGVPVAGCRSSLPWTSGSLRRAGQPCGSGLPPGN